MTIEYRVRPVTRYIVTRFTANGILHDSSNCGEFANVKSANKVCAALAATEEGALSYLAPLHDSDCAVHNAPAYPEGQCDCSARGENELVD
jgi:hypothetical protein